MGTAMEVPAAVNRGASVYTGAAAGTYDAVVGIAVDIGDDGIG